MLDVTQVKCWTSVLKQHESCNFLQIRMSNFKVTPRQTVSQVKAKPISIVSVFSSGQSCLGHAALAAAFLCCGVQAQAQALPSGGHFIAGSGSIGGNGSTLTIKQTTPTGLGVIDWNSFSIGNGHNVVFDNGTGATLNRVTGGATSVIIGTLSATGSLYLINPQGLVVGTSGIVSTGGRFVASTLDTHNAAFMQGEPLTLSGNSTGSVINLGRISSTGGDVFLIARTEVVNQGTISAPNGSAELVAGQEVLLQDSSSSPQVSVLTGSGGNVMNLGSIAAAQISLQSADGNVYAMAGNDGAIRATGTTTRDGHIWLVAEQGQVIATGPLQAFNADGSGGTVETDADTLSVGSATVLSGIWKLATPVFRLDSTMAPSFTRSLNAGTSIEVTTNGTGSQGNLTIASSLQWNGAASLTLNANHDVIIDPYQTLRNTGSGNLTLRADNSALDNGGSVFNFGTLDWSGSTGIVSALYDMNGSYSPGTVRSNPAWFAAPDSGLVEQITIYQLINSLRNLQSIALNLAGTYALGINLNDPLDPTLSFNRYTLTPLGSVATPFTGQFDGMGHTISGLYAPVSTQLPQTYGQLFGVIGPSGVVRNVGVTNVENYNDAAPSVVGVLAGLNQGTIVNAYATGNIGTFPTSGGLVGINDGLIERSWSNVIDPGYGAVGLVGRNNGAIVPPYAVGTPTETSGTLAGGNHGTITQSSAIDQASNATGDGRLVFNKASSGTQLPTANSLPTTQMSTPASFVGWDFGATGVCNMPLAATGQSAQ